jgi:rSAM/selenodomain-associated transferase 2
MYVFSMPSPLISVIIPVLNEADTINRTLAALDTLNVPHGLEVVVVDGSSRGTTLKAVAPSLHPTLRVKTAMAPKGRGAQMNCGAALADGRILLFLHADTTISQEAVDRLQREMKCGDDVVGGAFGLEIHSTKKIYRLIETMANQRSRVTKLPYGDQAIFLRTHYFFRIGGFADIPLMEDVDLMQRIRKKKGKITMLPVRVRTSARRWEKEGAIYTTLRNWMLILLYLLGASPFTLAKFYKF